MKVVRDLIGSMIVGVGFLIVQIGFGLLTEDMQERFAEKVIEKWGAS